MPAVAKDSRVLRPTSYRALMFITFIVGTAGSGKSLMTAALEKWLAGIEMSVAVVNLDPGVDDPPYTSDVDVREYVD
ncbi:MAG TPA: hypothetical protein ENG31_01815, partial [Candidatus Thorarchaeota archaeon]|nr:hypothetical protein [Candidatus Thorarchaeota archaeon]